MLGAEAEERKLCSVPVSTSMQIGDEVFCSYKNYWQQLNEGYGEKFVVSLALESTQSNFSKITSLRYFEGQRVAKRHVVMIIMWNVNLFVC